MEVGRVESVLHTLDRDILFPSKLDASFDDIHAKKTSTLRSELRGSPYEDARVVELDMYDEDDSEDEGEVMLLAMILLQLHGVKFPGGFPDQHNKKKRQRTSPDQLAILETIFQTDKMPSQQTRVQLADQLGMSSRRVQIWFQNKRAKVKRGHSKSEVPSPPLNDSRDSLASSSGSSEPSSPIVPDSISCSSTVLSLLSSPSSPASLVPSSPSLPHSAPKHHTQVSQIQFSLSSLAQHPILV